MEYLLFTLLNCENCEIMKDYLKKISLQVKELDLVKKDSKMEIRHFLKVLNRDDKGGIILPTLIALEEGKVQGVFNTPEELDAWLKSRD